MFGVQIASFPHEGGPGPTFSPAGSCALTVASTAYARPGTLLLPGDVVLLDRMAPEDRILATHDSSAAGDSFALVVARGGTVRRFIQTVAAPEPASYWAPSAAVKIITLLVGLFLLWRGRDGASLHYGIASICFAIAILPFSDAALLPAWRNLYEMFGQIAAAIAAYTLYLTFEDLSRGVIRERVLAVCRVVVAASALLFATNAIAFSIGRSATGCFIPWLYAARFPSLIVALVVMLGVLTTTFVRATGLQRQRVRWVFWSTVFGFSGVVVWLIVPTLRLAALTSVVITIGYAYAILRHRIIDVGFVVNRAIVFTTVTTAVFAIFALLSSFVERLTLPPSESVIVQSVAALALAFSFDFGYKRVENVIDRVFFRDKHAAEVALRRFIDEARFIRSADALLERTAHVVRDSLGASSVGIYREHGASYRLAASAGGWSRPDLVGADDRAFVRLRTYLSDVDLDDVASMLGETGVGFALAVQGRMLGAIIVGGRADEESYDPEERSLMRTLAREVGAALQAITASDQADLIEQLASGNLDAREAMARAKALTVRGS
jgi:hypothetical protein